MPEFKIRPATLDDAAGIATVQYHGWQQTYRGIISDAFLAAMTIEGGTELWKHNLKHPKGSIHVMVNDEDKVIAFSGAGRNRTVEFNCDSELYALYLLKEYHGQGLGKKLFMFEMQGLIAAGYKSCFVHVLADNPNVKFYRSFKPDLERSFTTTIGGQDCNDLCLAWSNITTI
ncbi:MAG TPA: GNAT family N-acetyltransferase [Chitinophagales bacterium]|nr:GNAT family N-acetyltransferase [Chitinophagales bacterium]